MPTFDEKHFTVTELSQAWNVNPETIRRIFRNLPGVLKLDSPGNQFKRPYRTLRIPESVAKQVWDDYARRQPKSRRAA